MEKVLQDKEAQVEEKDTQFEGGITEDADKCCLCVPIKLGVTIIGILMVLSGALGILSLLGTLSVNIILAIIFGASLAPVLVSSFFFLKYLLNDTPETRAQLPTACALIILSQIIGLAGNVVYVLFYGASFGSLINQLISSGITAVLYFYYMGVCKRFAESA
eukprot:CAMPEP_0168612538 /NCGR_PEP_ID=MMETSP0449_2-20121227/2971_1 /TAXON_ID=1082188 /ORGANISM="Strombidium rassoulzadegani, Strain ras09" /LENGTH=161 /DNA_ID=CAMNT_0008653111 /DNA_START=274 /DNA_END=759 /DNA_ORIENTATION=+